MPTLTTPHPEIPEQRVTMEHISWETYEGLLAEQVDRSAPRFTYVQGALEIMSPPSEHEELKEIMAAVADILAEEWGFEFKRFGSATCRRRDLARGAEPDACFYLQNVERIRGEHEIDLAVHPPPDLVIEVEIASPVLDKLSIYAGFGVPEIWWYDGKHVKLLRLMGGRYEESRDSGVLPPLTQTTLSEFPNRQRLPGRRMLRDWAREGRD